MNTISVEYLSRSQVFIIITTLTYFLMNGAQIFETAAIVPRWAANPPYSFRLFKGNYGLDLKTFWIVFHSIHEITFILAIIFCWKLVIVRNWLCFLFAIHFAVRAWTILYFAPHIMEFQAIANTDVAASDELWDKTQLWVKLNYLRVSVFIAVSISLVPLCWKVILMGGLNEK